MKARAISQQSFIITIKLNELPSDVRTLENNWKEFDLDCEGQLVRVKVKPKVYHKLEQAQANYPQWVAAIAKRCCVCEAWCVSSKAQIAGKMGEPI